MLRPSLSARKAPLGDIKIENLKKPERAPIHNKIAKCAK